MLDAGGVALSRGLWVEGGAVEECYHLSWMQEGQDALEAGNWLARGEVGRPGWQGEHAAVGVVHDKLDEVSYLPHVANRQGVAVQGMNWVTDGDAAQRLLGPWGSLRITSRRGRTNYCRK
jgi:hypothetical protein